MQPGTRFLDKHTCEFTVWAPFAKSVMLQLVSPKQRKLQMVRKDCGYWQVQERISGLTHYFYTVDQMEKLPDPASHFQPQGVHGPSQVVFHPSFKWADQAWTGIELKDYIIYELHVGTFTKEGTFAAVIPRLQELKDLGITAIEIMPIAAFPGKRNWGYDGVFPYAVQNSYGTPDAFKQLVNACHAQGIAVVLDVVYNHLGPEGNIFHHFGPYFTGKYKTPWGGAMNFDDALNDEVRRFFIHNALYWFETYHVDALRLDAIQAIFDQSAYPFLSELSDKVKIFNQTRNRNHYLIAESDLNDTRVSQPVIQGGYGMDASWCDDLHHSLHALSTGERHGYYADFDSFHMLYKAMRDGYAFTGQYSKFRQRRYGSSRKELPGKNLIVFAQNHDQVGNRLDGGRLAGLVGREAVKWAAALVLLSPYVPLLFMGEEYGETRPFYYFVDHKDPKLNSAVKRGRAREFKAFRWKGTMADPKSRMTFLHSVLQWEAKKKPDHLSLWKFYQAVIKIRKAIHVPFTQNQLSFRVNSLEDERLLTLCWTTPQDSYTCLFHCAREKHERTVVFGEGAWSLMLDSSASCWDGVGSCLPLQGSAEQTVELQPFQVAVFKKE